MNGKLAAVALASADTPISVYRCQYTDAAMVSVSICNRSTEPTQITLSTGIELDTTDLAGILEFKTELQAKNVLERTAVIVASGEYITIESTQAEVSVVVMGVEMGTPDASIEFASP